MRAETLAGLNRTQDEILDRAALLVGAGGTLAYATCSMLPGENRARVKAFLARSPGWTCVAERQWLPDEGGDGFYLAQLTRGE